MQADQLVEEEPLSTKELRKLQGRCEKWLERFASALKSPHLSHYLFPSPCSSGEGQGHCNGREETSQQRGFVVLNGGLVAGSSPYEVRQKLVSNHLICFDSLQEQQTARILYYSSTLPFIIVACPLQQEGSGNIMPKRLVKIQLNRNTRDTVERDENKKCRRSSTTATTTAIIKNSNAREGPEATEDSLYAGLVTIYALRQERHAAGPVFSSNGGCGWLFLLECDTTAVLNDLGRMLQKPALGIEALLQSRVSQCATAEDSTQDNDVSHDALRPQHRYLKCAIFPQVPGLVCVPDFITQDEHDAILKEVQENRSSLPHVEYLSRRRVAHFNRRFIYGVNRLGEEGVDVNPTPSYYSWMQERLRNRDPSVIIDESATGAAGAATLLQYPLTNASPYDQLTVNYYDCSAMSACGIATHVDAHSPFCETVALVSLGSYTVMEFCPCGISCEVEAPVGVYMAPRSLVLLTGDVRYGWTHCISERRTDILSELLPTAHRGDRVSLTWRTGTEEPHFKTDCRWPELCDGI